MTLSDWATACESGDPLALAAFCDWLEESGDSRQAGLVRGSVPLLVDHLTTDGTNSYLPPAYIGLGWLHEFATWPNWCHLSLSAVPAHSGRTLAVRPGAVAPALLLGAFLAGFGSPLYPAAAWFEAAAGCSVAQNRRGMPGPQVVLKIHDDSPLLAGRKP